MTFIAKHPTLFPSNGYDLYRKTDKEVEICREICIALGYTEWSSESNQKTKWYLLLLLRATWFAVTYSTEIILILHNYNNESVRVFRFSFSFLFLVSFLFVYWSKSSLHLDFVKIFNYLNQSLCSSSKLGLTLVCCTGTAQFNLINVSKSALSLKPTFCLPFTLLRWVTWVV